MLKSYKLLNRQKSTVNQNKKFNNNIKIKNLKLKMVLVNNNKYHKQTHKKQIINNCCAN